MVDYLTHPLDGGLERVLRADEHLADLRQRIAAALKKQEDAIVVQFNPNPPHSLVLLRPGETFVSMRIAILIGEICYNLRSALDYFVFELAKLNSGTEQRGTQFPIMDARQDFDGRGKGTFLKGVNPAHVAAIERLQPYMGCDWTKALRDFSNPDKHREFVQIGGNFTAWGYSIIEDPNFDLVNAPIRRTPHPVHGEVDVKIYFTATISFADGTPLIETLEIIKLNVADTLAQFKSEF